MTKKQCPLKFNSPDRQDWGVDCSERSCAWWSNREDECAVLAIAIHLRIWDFESTVNRIVRQVSKQGLALGIFRKGD